MTKPVRAPVRHTLRTVEEWKYDGPSRDLRFAARALARRPAFSLIVIGMLALGVAGTSAIFSVFNGLFLWPLPFEDPDRLVDIDETAPRWDLELVGVSYPDFHDWREQNRTFEAMSVFDRDSFNMALGDRVLRVDAAKVTRDMAAVLRVAPLLGRHITAEDNRPEAEKVVLVGRASGWRRSVSPPGSSRRRSCAANSAVPRRPGERAG